MLSVLSFRLPFLIYSHFLLLWPEFSREVWLVPLTHRDPV